MREAEAAFDDPEFVHGLQSLRREAGVRVMLDNFGAGPASLSGLLQCPVDGIKLDRRHVRVLATDERTRLWIEGIVFMAHRLGLDVVAEGVETEDQLAIVRAIGCDAAQGFLLAHPRLIDD